jgi:hypothetical protein
MLAAPSAGGWQRHQVHEGLLEMVFPCGAAADVAPQLLDGSSNLRPLQGYGNENLVCVQGVGVGKGFSGLVRLCADGGHLLNSARFCTAEAACKS